MGTEVEEDGVDEINAAFLDCVEAGKSEDDVKMSMIGAGATFKNVTRLYNQYMIDGGFAMSKEEKTTLIDGLLDDADITSEEGFTAALNSIVEEGTNITDKSASALIRKFGKDNDIEVFKKAVGTGGTRNPFVANFHAGLIDNPSMDEDGLKAIIADLTPEQQVNPTRWLNQHNAIRKMANAIAEKLAA